MSQFNTGDNKPLRVGVLRQSCDWLQAQGHEFKGAVGDIKGTYAFLMRYQSAGYYLVARRAKPFLREGVLYISSQRFLIIRAAEDKRPILVAIWPEKETKPIFQVFDAGELKKRYAQDLLDRENDNIRMGVRMLNYEWALGMPVNPMKLWETLKKVREAIKDRKHFEQTDLSRKLEITVDQRMLTCKKCGCLFSNRLLVCPGCGEGAYK